MHKSGKYKLVVSIGLSILLIIQGIILMVIKPDALGFLWLFSIILIGIAIISVAVNYRHFVHNRSKLAHLNTAYRDLYMDAVEAIGLSSMSRTMKKEIAGSVLEIFEIASAENKSPEAVTGGDLKAFLKPFLDVAGAQFSFLYFMIYGFQLFIAYMLMMKTYKVLREGFAFSRFETETLDLGITFTYLLIAFVFFPALMLLMKKAAAEQWRGIKYAVVWSPFLIPIGLMCFLIFVRNDTIRAFLDQPIPMFGSLSLFILGLCVFGLTFLIKHFIQRHNLRRALEKL